CGGVAASRGAVARQARSVRDLRRPRCGRRRRGPADRPIGRSHRRPAQLLSRPRSARPRRPARAPDHHGSFRSGRHALRRSAPHCWPKAGAGHVPRHHPARHHGPKHGGQHERGSLRRGRVFLWRPLGQEPLDQSSRSPAAHLRAGGTAGADADRRRGVSGLPVARQRIAGPRLVPRRPPAPDRHRMVAEPPPAANRPPTHHRRRSTMTPRKCTIPIAAACVGLAALLTYAGAAQSLKVDFSDETVGGEPKSFVSVVGVWRIESDGNNKVLVVDGRQWKEGQTAAGIADKARALYGDRYAEFLDRVQAYAYFPYVVAKDVTDFRDGDICVRLEGIPGRIDQGAEILSTLKPNGDYLTVRANPLENNLVLWKFEKGKRSSVKWIRNTPTPTRQWHDLKVRIAGPKVAAYLDGKLYLEHVLPEPVSGRIGLWSKADSHMYFDDFTVTPAD